MDSNQGSGSVTFDEIVALNRERMSALGIAPRIRTAESSLMQIMSAVGELASLAYRGSPLTNFEQEEVASILGSLAVHLATLGEVYKVNIGDSAIQRINMQLSRHELRKSRCASPPPPLLSAEVQQVGVPAARTITETDVPQTELLPLNSPPPPQTASRSMHELPLLLSPVTRRSFFPQLDKAAQFSPEAFNRLGLTFTAPLPDGRVVELIPNGSNVRVTHDKLDAYLKACQPLREAHDLLHDAPPSIKMLPNAVAASGATVTSPEDDAPVVVKHVDVPAPAGYDAEAVKKMFSPTHFQHGLFSPHSTATGFDIPYPTEDEGHASPAAVNLQSPAMGPMPTLSASQSPQPTFDFTRLIRSLEAGEITPQQLASLRLRFVVLSGDGRTIELTPGGSNVPVTMANVDEFTRLAKERLGSMMPSSGNVRRTESIKRLEVSSAIAFNPAAEREKFSPTHFAHNMFAPHEQRTQFFVDYDHEEDCLPEALRHPPSQPEEGNSTAIAALGNPSGGASHYVEYLTSRGVEGFRGVIEQVEKNLSTLRRFGVTWCIPSSLAGHIGDDDPLYDLIIDGRRIPVEEGHATIFLGMVRRFL